MGDAKGGGSSGAGASVACVRSECRRGGSSGAGAREDALLTMTKRKPYVATKTKHSIWTHIFGPNIILGQPKIKKIIHKIILLKKKRTTQQLGPNQPHVLTATPCPSASRRRPPAAPGQPADHPAEAVPASSARQWEADG